METKEMVTTEMKNGIVVLNMHGDVTPFSEKAVMDAYEKHSAGETQKILINFSNAKYINSGGIAIIISLVSEARKKNQKVGVCCLTPHFVKIFDMIGLSDYVEMYETDVEALQLL
ncbi:MAG: STAS domain-containing protein [Bacteroidetes bacterium]|nr:STAS domain-containing protein [Bacteroidota bacterium]